MSGSLTSACDVPYDTTLFCSELHVGLLIAALRRRRPFRSSDETGALHRWQRICAYKPVAGQYSTRYMSMAEVKGSSMLLSRRASNPAEAEDDPSVAFSLHHS